MATLDQADFYYGAAMMHLINENHDMKPSLLEGTGENRVYNISTNRSEYRFWSKYAMDFKEDGNGGMIWSFTITTKEIKRIQNNRENGKKNVIALVCGKGKGNLKDSYIGFLTDLEIEKRKIPTDATQVNLTVVKQSRRRALRLWLSASTDISIKPNIKI